MELNPFLSVWTRPKETIKQVVDNKTTAYALAIAGTAGITGILTSLQDTGWFLDLPPAVFIIGIIVAGALSGLVTWCLTTALYTWIGKLYGGHGTMRNMGVAVGPMLIPQVAMLPIMMVFALIYGEQFFALPADFALTSIPGGAYALLMFFSAVTSIWGTVISSKGIGVVHGFSSWRGFGVLMTIVAITIILSLFVVLIFIISVF